MNQNREKFDNHLAAIFALAGSAIGLGNIWRFPYIMGQNGGAAFIIVYILCSFFVALPIFFSESVIGRSTNASTSSAFRKLAPGSKWKHVGILCTIAPLIILSYYSVVGGWSIAYLFRSVFNSFEEMSYEQTSSLFAVFNSSTWRPILFHTIFLILSVSVVSEGVKKGIQKLSNITLPVLFVIMVLLMVISLQIPGAEAGVKYLAKPDFSKIGGSTIAAALGQSFFSLSLGVGTILTYSSYMKKEDSIISAGIWTMIFDLLFALIAGFVIMPAVFAVNIEPAAGPGLVFESLPFIFAEMGSFSPALAKFVSISFFFAILLAALTSEVSMFEVCTAYLVEKKNMGRKMASNIIFLVAWVLGVLCCISPRLFDILDFSSSNILMTLGALLFCLFVGWKLDETIVRKELTNDGSLKISNCLFKPVYFLIKYAAPIAIVIIFVSSFIS